MRTNYTKGGSHSSLGRALLKMTRLVALFGVLVMTTGYVHASVQYERTGATQSIPQGYGGTGGSKLFYQPQSSGTMINYDGTPFFTTSTTITTVRVKIVSGTTCSAMASMSHPLRVMAQTGTTYNVTSGTASGDYCDLTFGTAIPTSTALTYIRGSYSSSGATSTAQYNLAGSTGNSGYSFDWDSGAGETATATGGFAFALCSAFSCSGVSWEPENSISVSLPVASSTISQVFSSTFWQASVTTELDTSAYLVYFDFGQYPGVWQYTEGGTDYYNGYSGVTAYEPNAQNLATGVWYVRARLMYDPSDIVSQPLQQVAVSSTVSFTVSDSAVGTLTASSTPLLPDSPAPIECSTFDIGCYIAQAFQWAFYPSVASREQFGNLTTVLSGKFPFAYAYDVGDLYDEMFNGTGTSTVPTIAVETAIGTLTFISEDQLEAIPYIDTFRTLIGYCIWFMFAMFCYRRILRIHDTNTTV